jgi:hypothetical protein
MRNDTLRVYCVDNNIFIALTSHYPPEIFPTLWANIEVLVDSQRLLVPEQVVRENNHEWTADWITQRGQIIRPFDTACNACMVAIMAALPNFVDASKTGDDADQFLVALAMSENRRLHGSEGGTVAVLSNERGRRGNETRLRIPDACRHFNIDCFDLFAFMQAEGWRF